MAHLTEALTKQGTLEETIAQFTSQLRTLDDADKCIRYLRILIGEEGYDDPQSTKQSMRYDRLNQHLDRIKRLIQLYQQDPFPEEDIRRILAEEDTLYTTPATHRFSMFSEFGVLFGNEGPRDNLSYLKRNHPFIRDIVSLGSTGLYDALEETIEFVFGRVKEIQAEIQAEDEIKGKVADRKDLPRARFEYYRQEFLRKDRVLPILQDMKLIYETAIRIIEGISKEYSKPN